MQACRLGLHGDTFATMPLARWRAVNEAFDGQQYDWMRIAAWSVSHLLIAAGADADAVTPGKLLGEPEPRRRKIVDVDEQKRRKAERLLKRWKEQHGE